MGRILLHLGVSILPHLGVFIVPHLGASISPHSEVSKVPHLATCSIYFNCVQGQDHLTLLSNNVEKLTHSSSCFLSVNGISYIFCTAFQFVKKKIRPSLSSSCLSIFPFTPHHEQTQCFYHFNSRIFHKKFFDLK